MALCASDFLTCCQQHLLLPSKYLPHRIPAPKTNIVPQLFKKYVWPCQLLCFPGSYPRFGSTAGFQIHSSLQLAQNSSLTPSWESLLYAITVESPATWGCCPGGQRCCTQCPAPPASNRAHGFHPWSNHYTDGNTWGSTYLESRQFQRGCALSTVSPGPGAHAHRQFQVSSPNSIK